MTRRRNRVQKVLDATSQEVATLGLAERRDLFIVLRQAEVELSVGLSEWLKTAPDGASRFTAQQLRNALANTRVALQTLRRMNPRLMGAMESLRSRTARMATNHVEAQLLQFSSLFDGVIKPPNIRVAAVLARGEQLLLRRHESSARRYSENVQQHVRRQLAMGVVKGESFDAVIGRLTRLTPARLLEGDLDPASAMARGLMQMPRSSAARLVRTEAIHAYNIYHLESINEMADDDETIRKRWDSSLDRRGCLTCRDLDGEVRKPGEKFSAGMQHPPAHPN